MRAIPFVHRLDADEEAEWLEAFARVLPDAAVKPLTALSDTERAAAEVALVANPDPADLARLPRLRWIQSLWAGVERLVRETPARVEIVRMVDPALAAAMAEAVLAWTFYLHRDMPRYRRQQQAAEWRQHEWRPARERKVGLLGLGEMGRAAAARLSANGFPVIGWSRSSRAIAGVETRCGDEGLADVLARADILVVLLPLTDSTRGLLGAEALAAMRPGASLINFARGAIVDETSLLARLEARLLDHAVLDVFTTEPLPARSPLWAHPHVTVLPHISGPTSVASAAGIAAANLGAFLRGGRIPPTVDRARGY